MDVLFLWYRTDSMTRIDLTTASSDREVIVMTTGGTIEKSYNEGAGALENREPLIKKMILGKLRLPGTSLRILPLLNKDSLHITEEERRFIVGKIHRWVSPDVSVVVLHGTDTMTQTAEEYVCAHPSPPAPVVFTGAMAPLGFEGSDAAQNIAEALLAVRLLEPGVYVSFHNRIFPVPGAVKNYQLKTFEWKPPGE